MLKLHIWSSKSVLCGYHALSNIYGLIHFDQRVCVNVCVWGKVFMSQPTSSVSTSLLSHTTSCTGQEHTGDAACMCVCLCIRQLPKRIYWQVSVSLFPVLRRFAACSDTCLSWVGVCVCAGAGSATKEGSHRREVDHQQSSQPVELNILAFSPERR